jgi:hypothetical protein
LAFRGFLEHTLSIAISGSRPYLVLAAFFGLYAVFVATVRNKLLAANEKVLSRILLFAIGILDEFRALACVADSQASHEGAIFTGTMADYDTAKRTKKYRSRFNFSGWVQFCDGTF